jgi:hypothetical protein
MDQNITDRTLFIKVLDIMGCPYSKNNTHVVIDVGHNDIQEIHFVFDSRNKFVTVEGV